VDEIDKAFTGLSSSGSTDSGTTARVFGTFLTWLAEKQSAVFVVATANDISHLPPELLRKGRLDELFFVDLPDEQERAEIFRIHLVRRGRQPERFDLAALAGRARATAARKSSKRLSAACLKRFRARRNSPPRT
jgi:SpoVK/Ycf46/Vps4 family AAA+-type ATPase